MALSKERTGEIALAMLFTRLEQEGFTLKPREVRRDLSNLARKLSINVDELTDFFDFIIKEMVKRTMTELHVENK